MVFKWSTCLTSSVCGVFGSQNNRGGKTTKNCSFLVDNSQRCLISCDVATTNNHPIQNVTSCPIKKKNEATQRLSFWETKSVSSSVKSRGKWKISEHFEGNQKESLLYNLISLYVFISFLSINTWSNVGKDLLYTLKRAKFSNMKYKWNYLLHTGAVASQK